MKKKKGRDARRRGYKNARGEEDRQRRKDQVMPVGSRMCREKELLAAAR